MIDYQVLQIIWWCLVGVLLIGFALTSGMDMAVSSLLFKYGKNSGERGAIISTIIPHWDGNQVWLITAGGAVFAAWPEVYAASFSGLYFAMLLVLFGIWLRPLAFEYRHHSSDEGYLKRWDLALVVGSTIPLVIFGVAFGNLLQGLPFWADDNLRWHYEGYFLSALLPLLNPFALLCGVMSLLMLMTHGAMWVQLRCQGEIVERANKVAKITATLCLVVFAVAGIWAYSFDGFSLVNTPADGSYYAITGKEVVRTAHGLFANYEKAPIAVIFPILAFGGFAFALLSAIKKRPGRGILGTILGIVGTIATPAVALFPFILPSSKDLSSSLTVFDATSSHLTLQVMFIVTCIFVPIALSYTTWAYVKMWHKAPLTLTGNTYEG